MTIVETEDTLGGKPRLEGLRISVLQIAEMYIDVRKSEISESTGMPDSCDAKNSPSFSAHTRTGGSRDAGKSPEIIASST